MLNNDNKKKMKKDRSIEQWKVTTIYKEDLLEKVSS